MTLFKFTFAVVSVLALLQPVLVQAQGVSGDLDEWAELDDSPVNYENIPMEPKVAEAEAITPPEVEVNFVRQKLLPYSMIGFLGLSLLVGLWGARANSKITLAFEEAFCSEPDGVLWKQFTRLGKDKKLLVGESACTFKLHCKGHPLAEGAVVTMNLKRRHELVSSILEKLTGAEDSMCVEFYLKDGVIPPMVLAIASTNNFRELLRNNKDVKQLATQLSVDEKKLKDWPSDDLVVFAEHPSYFYDLMTKEMMNQVFGAAAFRKLGKYFRGLQISSDSNSNHKKVMRWWVTVPRSTEMDKISILIRAMFAMLRQLDDYKISAERRQQAEKVRKEAEAGEIKAVRARK